MNRRISPSLVAISLLFLSIESLADTQIKAQYQLGPNDRVKIIVFGHDDLSGEFLIDDQGRLSLPLIQIVEAQGLTPRQLEASITSKLKPDFLINPRVSVEVLSYRQFYIMGEVKKPGGYAYVNGMTAVNAVALAGGYTYRAKKSYFFIIRENDSKKEKIKIDMKTAIRPGDVIEVPERYF